MRNFKFLVLFLIAISLAFRSVREVHADGYCKPAFTYLIDQSENGGVKSKTTRQILDFSAGYLFEGGFALFGQYDTEKKTVTSSSTGSPEVSVIDTRTSMGPGLGWKSPNKDLAPYLFGTYYYQNEDVWDLLTYKGTGYQVDLGLSVMVKKVAVAFQLSYRYFKYTKYTTSGSTTTTLTQPKIQSNLDPGIALMIEF